MTNKRGEVPTVDEDTFKSAMRQLAGCVTVIATEQNGELYGLTATAVCSVCVSPPTILVVVNSSTRTHLQINRRGTFSINILASDQKHIAELFATPSEEKFKSVAYFSSNGGLPLIERAAAHLECVVQQTVQIGTHTIFIAQATEARVHSVAPLIYHDTKYGLVAHAFD